jgi:hypothetical protein
MRRPFFINLGSKISDLRKAQISPPFNYASRKGRA